MKFVALALILICINIGMSLVNLTGVFGEYQKNPQTQLYDTLDSDDWRNSTMTPNQVTSGVSWDIGDYARTFQALLIIGKVILMSVVAVPYMFMQFGLPFSVSFLLSLPFYAVYLIGLAEFLSNRSTS
jgi:hypothetical protein